MVRNEKRDLQSFSVVVLICSALLIASEAMADVFPNESIAQDNRSGSARYNGVKRALYFVVHDDDDVFTTQEWNDRVASIRSKEIGTREFYATNSGGKFDLYYEPGVVIDAAIPLNSDGTRPGNWVDLANNIATGPSYNLNLGDYYMFAYDVDDTQPDPGQGWGGLSTGDSIYLQSTGQRLINHEIGHQVNPAGNDHGMAIRQLNDADYHSYYWDEASEQYKPYEPGASQFVAVPFGAPEFEYGNPFDTMGHGSGDFRLEVKRRNLNWLTSSQVPDLNSLGEGTYRIYAHDELQATTKAPDDPSDPNDVVYGVSEGYNPGVYYGLTYTRQGQAFDKSGGDWDPDTQRIDIEYRSGEDGALFYLDGAIVDLDPEGGESYSNNERLLEVGKGAEDIDFGMSTYIVSAGAIGEDPPTDDFLDYNPPPPVVVAGNWFHFSALGTGSDAIGSFIELAVSLVSPLNGIDGDLNQDGEFNSTDVDLFVAGWLTDTSTMNSVDKYYHGDIDFNGLTDLVDAYLLHTYLVEQGSGGFNFSLLGVPEPGTLSLLAVGAVALAGLGSRHRLRTQKTS